LTRRHAALGVAGAVLLLALAETVSAVVSPLRAPTDTDWQAAGKQVRTGFRAGDLVVAAPDWADQVMRLHLGDLVPVPVAARLDAGRFPRVWEISQRGASAPEAQGGKLAAESRHGALRVRLWEREALAVTYDFYDHWRKARVVRKETAREDVPCELLPDRHQCPDIGFNVVKPRILEIGNTLRRALEALPVQDATVVIEFPDVPLGRELAVAGGLHHVWMRKAGDGMVRLRALIDGQEVVAFDSGSRTGWKIVRADTSAWRGRQATVRFEVTSDRPYGRHFGFAAEARGL
jgi:hypothetical protein